MILKTPVFLLLATPMRVAARAISTAATTMIPTTDSRIRGAFYGSVVADALTLGTHYEYDAARIRAFYGKIDRYYAPGEKTGGETHGIGWGARNYHGGNGRGPPKRAGENTDYGDYNVLILEYLAASHAEAEDVAARADVAASSLPVQQVHTPPIQLQKLIPMWLERLKTWRAWMCTQTKQTMDQVVQGVPLSRIGGMSNAMALRHAAAYAYYEKEEEIVDAARASMFTHRESTALEGGEFFARVTHRVIHSAMSPRKAIESVAADDSSSAFIKAKVRQALAKVDEALDETSHLYKEDFADDLALTSMARLWDVGRTEPIKVGKASPTEGTLPGSIYFIVKYAMLQERGAIENAFAAAASSNAEVGGDNASRAIAIGMVLGAAGGVETIPEEWGRGKYAEWESCEKLLNRAPLLMQQQQQQQRESSHREL